MREILVNDWQTLKIMSPYIFLGLMLSLCFVLIQIMINQKYRNGKDVNEKKE